MSEVQEQTQNVHKLAEALILARSALAGAEAAAKEYNAAVASGAQQAELAAAAVHEANVVTARAASQAAEATLKAAVDGTTARRAQEQAAREAAAAERAAAEVTRRAAEQEREARREAARVAQAAAAAEAEAIRHAAEIEKAARREAAKVAQQAAAAEAAAAAAKAKAERDAAEAIKQAERDAAAAYKQAEQERAEAWRQAEARGRALEEANKRRQAEERAASGGSSVSLRGIGAAAATVAGSMAAMGAAAMGAYSVLSQATAEYARHDRALRLLGNSYAAVERATNGAMSAEQALNLQGQIQTAGVRVNAEQLGLLARAAREYALATGNDASQAVEKLSNAIVNNSEDALSELNLAQARSTNSTQTLANMTALLAERYRGLAPTAQQADERVQSFERAAKEAGNTLLTVVARGAEGALGALFSLGGGSETVTQTLKDMSREVRDLMNSTGEASVAAVQAAARARTQFEIDRRAFQSSSMMQGSGLVIPRAQELNDAERQSISQLFGEASRLSNEVFQQRLREILELHEKNAQAARDEREQAEQTARNRRDFSELNAMVEKEASEDRRQHAGDELGLLRQQAQQLGLRVNLTQQAVTPQQRMNFLQREMLRLTQDETRNRDAIAKNLREQIQLRSAQVQHSATDARQAAREREELRRVSQELNELYGDAERLEAKIQTVDQRAGESSIEWLRRRIEAQRAVNTAAEEGLSTAKEELALLQEKAEAEAARARAAADEANQRDIDNQRAKQAAQFELNSQAAARARADSLDQRLRDSFGLAQDQTTTTTQAMVEATRAGAGSIRELAESSVNALITASQRGEDAGAVLAAEIDKWATAKAVQWGMQSAESFAGAGLAYFIRPDAVPGLLAAGAGYAALALGAGVTAAAIPDAPAGGSAGGARAGEVSGAIGMASARNDNAAGMRDRPAINVNISGVMANEQTQAVLFDAFRQLQDRGFMTG